MNELDIFSAAIELEDPTDRARFLDEACGDQAALRGRIEELLRNAVHTSQFLQAPAVVADGCLKIDHVMPYQEGSQIGPYKLREQIGEGGMGVVYVAEQSEPVKRKVALKIVKPGMASKDVLARFESERQTLAMMDHPNIARIIDAGSTDSGQHYFVMELVFGIPITEYCNQHALTTEQRMSVFCTVCRAVQHAHQKGVIHRDLKPNNVLVASIDGQPVPKIIDFGVAKATVAKLGEETIYTHFSQVVGTPLYMSPEQAELGVADVDTRSDVYALGVLLYELITGQTPFDVETLKKAGFDEMRRIIREDEPLKPSAKVSTLNANALSTAFHGQSRDPKKVSDRLKGEVDWLVMKALEKDRDRRYQSPTDLASDVQRYLDGEVVEASPPSTFYRIKKMAMRYKLQIIAGAAVLLAMGAGTAIAVRQAQKAIESQETAESNLELAIQKTRESEAIANFVLDGLVRTSFPENARGSDPTIRQFLIQAEDKIEEAFGDQPPRLQAWVRHKFGLTFRQLGDFEVAERNVAIALKIRRELHGDEHPETLLSADMLAGIWSNQGKTQKAIELAMETLERRQRLQGPKHKKTLQSLNTLGRAYLDAQRCTDAEDVFEELLVVAQELNEPEQVLWASNNLAIALKAQGKLDGAEEHLRRVIKVSTTQLGEDHPDALDSMHNLAELLSNRGNYGEAKTLLQDVLTLRRRVQGESHTDTLKALSASGNLYFRTGERSNARAQMEELLIRYREKLGDHPQVAGVLNSLSHIDRQEGRLKDALARAEEAFAIFNRHLGSEAKNTLVSLNTMASAHKELGNWDEAKRCYKDVIARRQRIHILQPANYANLTSMGGAQCNLGNLLSQQKKYQQAVTSYQAAIESLQVAVKSSSLASARLFLRYSHWGCGAALRRLGKHEASLDELTKAKTLLAPDETDVGLEIEVYVTMAASGQSDDAIKQLEAVLAETDPEPEHWHAAARIYAIAANVPTSTDETLVDARHQQKDQYADRALLLLSKAEEAGYFDRENKIAVLEDDDFAAIRDRSEFISLLQRLREDTSNETKTGR